MAGASRVKSISSRNPVRSRWESMFATELSSRSTSCSLLISRLNRPDRLAFPDRGVLGEVEREAGLADAGPGGQDDQVRLLEPGGQRVEVGEPGADAADLAPVLVQVVEPVVRRVEQACAAARSRSRRASG